MLLGIFPTYFLLQVFLSNLAEGSLKEFIMFKQIEYEGLPNSSAFNAYNNVPQGFAVYETKTYLKVFIAVPRRSPGIPSTLNFIKLNLDDEQKLHVNPKLYSYPNYQMNELDPSNKPKSDRIVSVYRPRVDECDRLWFVDSGVINTSGNATVVQRPSIWVIDLRTDSILNRYEIPKAVASDGSGFASLTIDVIDCDGNTFAYLPNLVSSQIVVYNLNENRAYRVSHNFFHMHPFEGDYDVDGLMFSWDDAIFSIALSEREKNSTFRLAYFHPMSSFSEFAVSTRVLRNESLAARSYHGDDFKLIGMRGKNSQSTMHGVHQKTGAVFFAEINKNAVTCWNNKEKLEPSNLVEIARDNVTMVYPNDLSVVHDELWVMSNRMIRHLYSKIDVDDYNFRIFRSPVDEIIKDTKCAAKQQRATRQRAKVSRRYLKRVTKA